jgi:hypothetical protein
MSNNSNRLANAKTTRIPTTVQTRRGGGKYSVNLVCAKGNRKSLRVSKKLAEELALTTDVYITVYAENGLIALSPAALNEDSVSYSFSNDKDRIVYNAALAYFLADTFGLDYENYTSHSFGNVVFDTLQGIKTAIVVMNAKSSGVNTSAPLAEQEASDDSNVDDCP